MTPHIAVLVGARVQTGLALESAKVVAEELHARGHRASIVVVEGDDWYVDTDGHRLPVDRHHFALRGQERFDFAFLAIHDDLGKGPIQGYLDLLGVPYDSSGQLASLVADDKFSTKVRLSCVDVPLVEGVLYRAEAPITEADLLEIVGLPCFVKPNRGGSAIGSGTVSEATDLGPAIARALRWDDTVLIERFVPGREITCGVVTLHGEITTLPLTEYLLDGKCKTWELNQGTVPKQTPAALPVALASEIGDIARRAYRELNCRGLARVDFRLDERLGNAPRFLEVNTLPGLERRGAMLTQVVAAGLDVGEVFETLMLDSMAEREARMRPGSGC